MSDDDALFAERPEAAQLPISNPARRGLPVNVPVFEQDCQWRLKIQPFSEGGFEAKAVLVDRNRLNALLRSTKTRGKRIKPKDREDSKVENDRGKAAFRAARRVRQLSLEIKADRLLTLTSRNRLTNLDETVAAWKRLMRILDRAKAKFRYVAVPELHANGEHFHIHAAISGFIRVDTLRRCWQIALGGKGNERGADALGNVDIKRSGRYQNDPGRGCTNIARYLSKYITKGYSEQHHFNKKRYWWV